MRQLIRTPFLRRYETPVRRYVDSRRLFRALVSLAGREAVDVVHLASYQSPGLVIARSHRWPAVTRLSSVDFLLREAAGRAANASDRVLDRFEKGQAVASTLAFTPSVFLADRVNAAVDLTPRVLRTPPPAAPVKRPDAVERDLATVAFVGSGNRVKGFDLFLAAMEALLRRGFPAKIEIAGRPPSADADRSRLEALVAQWPDRVAVHGPISLDQVSALLWRVSCLVIPSRVDNYPNVCLEAQANGCPVIASRDSSLEEMVVDGVDGLLFANGSSDSLLEAVQRFLDLTPNQRAEMCCAASQADARRHAEQPLGQLVSLYDEARWIFRKALWHPAQRVRPS